MGEMISREQLDKRMLAWQMYYVGGQATSTIARHFGVSRQSIRYWITSLGGEIGDDEAQRAFKDRIRATLPEGAMLCAECEIITDADPSGLCADCRQEREDLDEHAAEMDFDAHWFERNFVVVRK